MSGVRVEVRVPEAVLEEIDRVRGDVSRSRWFLRLANEAVCSPEKPVPAKKRAARVVEPVPDVVDDVDDDPFPAARSGSSSRVSSLAATVPGVRTASSLAKEGVVPIPKRGG